jgi:hypothetical protein
MNFNGRMRPDCSRGFSERCLDFLGQCHVWVRKRQSQLGSTLNLPIRLGAGVDLLALENNTINTPEEIFLNRRERRKHSSLFSAPCALRSLLFKEPFVDFQRVTVTGHFKTSQSGSNQNRPLRGSLFVSGFLMRARVFHFIISAGAADRSGARIETTSMAQEFNGAEAVGGSVQEELAKTCNSPKITRRLCNRPGLSMLDPTVYGVRQRNEKAISHSEFRAWIAGLGRGPVAPSRVGAKAG